MQNYIFVKNKKKRTAAVAVLGAVLDSGVVLNQERTDLRIQLLNAVKIRADDVDIPKCFSRRGNGDFESNQIWQRLGAVHHGMKIGISDFTTHLIDFEFLAFAAHDSTSYVIDRHICVQLNLLQHIHNKFTIVNSDTWEYTIVWLMSNHFVKFLDQY